MARIYSSGFELQSATAGVEWSANTGTPSISTSTYRSGAAALRINPTAQNNAAYAYLAANVNEMYVRAYIRFPSLPSEDVCFLAVTDSAGYINSAVALNTDGSLSGWTYTDGAGNLVQCGSDSTETLDTDTWYRVEMYSNQASSSSSTVTVRLDGEQVCTGSQNPGTLYTNYGSMVIITDTAQGTTTMDMYFDDWAVNTTSGSYQNSWPGDGAIVHLNPDSAGDTNTCNSGTYASIDETTPSDADYVSMNASGQLIDVNLESSSSAGIDAGSTINCVMVGHRSYNNVFDNTYILRLKSEASGTTSTSSSIGYTTGTSGNFYTHTNYASWDYQLVSYQDPEGAGDWTTTLLDSTQIGIEDDIVQSGSYPGRTSILWLLVDYSPIAEYDVGVAEGVDTQGVKIYTP